MTSTVEGHVVACRDVHHPPVEVQPGRLYPQLPLRIKVRVEAQGQVVGTGLAGQDLLGQRRPVVRKVALRADDGEGAVVTRRGAGTRRRAGRREKLPPPRRAAARPQTLATSSGAGRRTTASGRGPDGTPPDHGPGRGPDGAPLDHGLGCRITTRRWPAPGATAPPSPPRFP